MIKLKIRLIGILGLMFAYTANSQEALFSAARSNNVQQLREQISLKNVDLNTIDERGSSALIIACYNNNFEAARILLEAGADPNVQDKMGNTALMGMCFKRYENIAGLLLEFKTDMNLRNFNGATAMIFAATFGADNILELLINKGADKTIRDNFKKTALDYAVLQENYQAIKKLE